jgi:hypothetical protein
MNNDYIAAVELKFRQPCGKPFLREAACSTLYWIPCTSGFAASVSVGTQPAHMPRARRI